ncbi:T-cell surface glycoprotein CD3 zeta chain-like [Plectropomus leopardus]|uniref:T-cell surface glycoprotein CD3 zeta chain-like n=1 Tax=Plectropomus leopardus TaxID=160734 RepID=UPI001C4BF6D6|nr:T-cell surface glycoprotein CD3 zeta chain-like [Plectropomus leopardus]
MNSQRTGVFVLFVLLAPVSAQEIFFTHPVICYFLDAFLVVYCITATALFFKEKFSSVPSGRAPADDGGIYQELTRPADTDTYHVLELSKGKKKGKKKKSESTSAEEKDKDPYESLIPNGSAPPPQSPQ